MAATLYVYAALFLQSQATSWDLRSMWASMSALPRIVVGILFVLSVYYFPTGVVGRLRALGRGGPAR